MPMRLERWIRSKERRHRPDAEQGGALGGPVAGGAGAVFFSCDDQQRHAVGGVPLRRVVDGHLLAAGLVAGEAASVPGASRLRSRMLAKVPRIITSWLPRRDP